MGTQLLTAGQVAERADVHRTTVHHWEKDGKIHAATVANGIRLFDPAEVDRIIAERQAQAALAIERGACPHPSCTNHKRTTIHNSDPCPYADEPETAA